MANTYRSSFVDPYPNGWKNKPDETTPIDAEAFQAHTDALKGIDHFLDGVNKDSVGQVQMRILTKEEWEALPDTKYTDRIIYFITDGGGGVSYPNYESEAF